MNINTAQLHEFMHAVAEMRQAQRTYFAQRSSIMLEKAKRLEQRVDELLARHQIAATPEPPKPSQGNLWS